MKHVNKHLGLSYEWTNVPLEINAKVSTLTTSLAWSVAYDGTMSVNIAWWKVPLDRSIDSNWLVCVGP